MVALEPPKIYFSETHRDNTIAEHFFFFFLDANQLEINCKETKEYRTTPAEDHRGAGKEGNRNKEKPNYLTGLWRTQVTVIFLLEQMIGYCPHC
jgi:hypothetical protein